MTVAFQYSGEYQYDLHAYIEQWKCFLKYTYDLFRRSVVVADGTIVPTKSDSHVIFCLQLLSI